MQVPLIDVSRQHHVVSDELQARWRQILSSGAFVGGPFVSEFETAFAEYLGLDHVVAVSSGTTALHLALRALALEPDDEVILPTNSFVATAEAVVLAGATPVFCDVDPDTALMTLDTVRPHVTDRTRVIVPVHLFGNVVDMDPLVAFAAARGLTIIEDAAQAHGAVYESAGREGRAGTLGHMACFSFYPTKNLGTVGEGGAVSTGDPRLAERVRALRDHGQFEKHVHLWVGDNGRMPALQGAALGLKLPSLDRGNARRREIATIYRAALYDSPFVPIAQPAWSESVYHLFVVRVAKRSRCREMLTENGVATAVHYPTPIHLQPAFARWSAGARSLPAAEALSAEIVSLPMFPELSDVELEHVLRTLRVVGERVARDAISAAA